MTDPNLVLLYVDDTDRSVAFYRALLGREPDANFPTFASFTLTSGATLGLWHNSTIEPPPSPSGNRTELAFQLESMAAVETTYEDWRQRGFPFAQPLTTMVFGKTFVALDPDGHRLRVCGPNQ